MMYRGKHKRRICIQDKVTDALAYAIAWPAAMVMRTWCWFMETEQRRLTFIVLSFMAALHWRG